MTTAIAAALIILLGLLAAAVRILPEYERGVVFRLGRAIGSKGPGLVLLIPLIDRMRRVSLRMVVLDIPPQDIITRDNVTVKVNAVNYFRVVEPMKSIIEVEDYLYATGQLAQTTLRSVLGRVDLDEVLAERDKINQQLQEILDAHTDPWGIKVSTVELKDVDIPRDMQRVIARQAEAERDRRAKVIMAQAEERAAEFMLNAARILNSDPVAVQLRFMQTLTEITGPNNTTTIVPIPVDLISTFMDAMRGRRGGPDSGSGGSPGGGPAGGPGGGG